jgi:nucleotide-binding universal stress UspA family protein
MRRIVIALDPTERSLDAIMLGKLLANATGSPAGLVSVVQKHRFDDPSGEALTATTRDAGAALRELADSAAFDVADVEVIPGEIVARELQTVTERDTTGVLVVGSTRRGPVGRLLLGGVGERLLTGSACPVAIAPHGYSERSSGSLGRVGVAFDGSAESRHALQAGSLLARASGAQLRVVTAFQPLAFGGVATLHTGGASLNELLRKEHRDALKAAEADMPEGVTVEARFIEGSPGEVLARESDELDLLITGSRGYGPRAAVLLGSTTQTLMRSAECPGLVMPRGASLQLE